MRHSRPYHNGLWRTPTHIGLIKRACDLSLHLKSSRFNTYMYQLVELLSMIAHTGDGSSFDKAIQVRSLDDALLFEQHWNETPREEILASREQTNKGKDYVVVEIQGSGKGKTQATLLSDPAYPDAQRHHKEVVALARRYKHVPKLGDKTIYHR